jgi:hypothetical protein
MGGAALFVWVAAPLLFSFARSFLSMNIIHPTFENGITVPSSAVSHKCAFYSWTGIAVGQSVFVPDRRPRIFVKRNWACGKKFVYVPAVKNGVHGKRFWRIQ